MPFVNALPTWLALNNANFTSPTGMTDAATGQPEYGGGLNVGDYSDYTSDQAMTASYTTNGILYSGRYRFVQVDSGATAANVKVGTVGYMRAGSTVKTVVVLTQGSGQTPGTYLIGSTGGGGTGAVVQVVVSSATAITATVVSGGYGYTSLPTFTLATGGTPGTVAAQLDSTPNVVTSFDVGVTANAVVRPVVFLNSITPGNYGFIQENGIATVLANAALTSATAGAWVNAKTSGAGTVDTTAASGSPIGSTIGQAIDMPYVSVLFKCLLDNPIVQD
jgi:hypothetical protein